MAYSSTVSDAVGEDRNKGGQHHDQPKDQLPEAGELDDGPTTARVEFAGIRGVVPADHEEQPGDHRTDVEPEVVHCRPFSAGQINVLMSVDVRRVG